jgi:hypothetical protein
MLIWRRREEVLMLDVGVSVGVDISSIMHN